MMSGHSYAALYYPFIHFKDDNWLKLSALYWDRIGRIVPYSYEPEDSQTAQNPASRIGFLFLISSHTLSLSC